MKITTNQKSSAGNFEGAGAAWCAHYYDNEITTRDLRALRRGGNAVAMKLRQCASLNKKNL